MVTQTINTTSYNFKDIDLSFAKNPSTKDVGIKTNQNAVRNAVRNLILTRNFEIPFHPEQGCQAASMLFEPMSPITSEIIKASIIQVLDKYEPRVKLNDIIVNMMPEANAYNVTVIFTIIGYTSPTQISIVLERTR